jgi:sialate O-acetylesterase
VTRTLSALCLLLSLSSTTSAQPPAGRWSEARANAWYEKQPWLVGSNYIPATAINELEMWQAETFDPATIDRELGWAEGLGMTTMRVFLHDLPWDQDAAGYRARIDRFLDIAAKHHIKPLFVLFDSCWDPDPRLGPQHAPTPGVHNSGWVQAPGARALQDASQHPRLRTYVTEVVRAFGKDPRVLGWDVWNEPDNTNASSYGAKEPANKVGLVLALLPQVFAWAREAGPEQPLTSGVWKGDWSNDAALSPMERIQLEHSDVISFHNYDNGAEFEKRIVWLQRYKRPILCTEYMARGNGSTFRGSLPIARKHKVAAINWGFVAGKTQTYLPWDSWQRPYVGREPTVWFHEIFKQDGTPYREDEVQLLRELTGRVPAAGVVLGEPFTDHAVLQRDRPIPVFGEAAPGAAVSITLGTVSATATADATGRWRTTLPAVPAGGPFTLSARTGSNPARTIDDVLVGDVWLCSGQSNMEMAVRNAQNAGAELAQAANDRLRLLQIAHATSAAPLGRFSIPPAWAVASARTVGDFSATCYFFARELQKTIDVPMGLIHASWGGSAIEPWISASGLHAIGGFDESLGLLRAYAEDPTAATEQLGHAWEAWWRAHGGSAPGAEPWQPSATSGWTPAPSQLGDWKAWGVPELASHDGMVWYRATITLSRAQAEGAARIALGGIDEVDETWVNGRPIGNTFGWGTERTYNVPAGVLKEGSNVVVTNVLSTWASGGLLGPVDKMVLRTSDGSVVPIGANWSYQVVPAHVGQPPRAPWEAVNGLSTMFNGMIAPLGPVSLRGAAWYQGESNAGRAETYERLLGGLFADWRGRFGADLPVLVVQLPQFGAPVPAPAESGWASVREAQRRAVRKDSRAGLAVTIDVGDRHELHPTNKQAVGARLARAARHVVYNEPIPPSGPAPEGARRGQDGVVVTFADVDESLVTYSARQPIGFEVCGETPDSCRFAVATVDGTRVVLTPPDASPVTRVRYCWGDAPLCNLYDKADLPAGPFEIAVE